MTVDKEAIKDVILNTVYYKIFDNDCDPILPLYSKPFYRNIIHEAMDEYAASLLKEKQELKEAGGALETFRKLNDKCKELLSSNEAKDREVEFLNQNCDNLMNEISQLKEALVSKAAKWYQDLLTEKDREIAELKEALTSTEKAYEIMRDKSEYWKARCLACERIEENTDYRE